VHDLSRDRQKLQVILHHEPGARRLLIGVAGGHDRRHAGSAALAARSSGVPFFDRRGRRA